MLCDYLITTKKRNHGFADQISVLMYVFATVIFIYYYKSSHTTVLFYPIIIAAILISLVVTLYKKKTNGEAFFRLGLLLAAMGWFLGHETNILMGILYTIAAVIEKQVKFPEEIGFTNDGITFNTFPKKKLSWHEVSNAMMKDGLITIDQLNNKLFQKEIEGEVSANVESEFNAYCRTNIGRNNINR